MDDLESVSLGSEFGGRESQINSSLSFISVQSLSSARGSTPLTKHENERSRIQSGRRYYDANQPMENDYDVPLYRLRCLHGLHKCGLLRVGDKNTDTKTRRVIDDYLKNSSKHAANTTRPRKEFPSLRSKVKAITNLRNVKIEQYFQNDQTRSTKPETGRKSVTFAVSGSKRPSTEHVVVKRPVVTVLQHSEEKSTPRPYSDKLLLRRPTMKPPQPLSNKSEIIKRLAKSVQLKPINFKTVNEQLLFYNKNFPLLLDAHGEEKAFFRRRTPTPDVRNSPEIQREVKLNTRMSRIESSLDTLDKETEDVDFRTVLRDDEFYPNRWSWNEKKSSDQDLTESVMAF